VLRWFRLVYQAIGTSDGQYEVVVTVDRREDVYEALKNKLSKE
jgi:mRNA interferase RelE/StbE